MKRIKRLFGRGKGKEKNDYSELREVNGRMVDLFEVFCPYKIEPRKDGKGYRETHFNEIRNALGEFERLRREREGLLRKFGINEWDLEIYKRN